jgi:ABC-type sugar transport system ATPase subunit
MCDRIVILRAGKKVGERWTGEASLNEIVGLMMGID